MSAMAFYRRLRAAGVDEATALLCAEAFEAEVKVAVAAVLEPRRAKDRERKKARNSTESVEIAESTENAETPSPLPLSPQTPLTPTPTPPEITTRARTSAKRPAKRCPEGWEPKPSTLAKLADEGFVSGDLERALTRMRDHEFKTAHSDWDAAFRNWVRADRDRKPRLIHERPHHDAKFEARQANHARALAGADSAARQRWEP